MHSGAKYHVLKNNQLSHLFNWTASLPITVNLG